MGIQTLKSHAEGKKHKQLCATVAVFLKTKPVMKSTTSSPDLCPVSNTSSSSDRHVTQKTLKLTKLQTLSAEIRWALESILKGHSILHQAIFHLYSKQCFRTVKLLRVLLLVQINCVI